LIIKLKRKRAEKEEESAWFRSIYRSFGLLGSCIQVKKGNSLSGEKAFLKQQLKNPEAVFGGFCIMIFFWQEILTPLPFSLEERGEGAHQE
jgi:hypothetical protein